MVKGRQGADNANQHGHWVRVPTETLVELDQLLMHHGVLLDILFEAHLLRRRRQFAMPQEVGDLQEVALFGQLLDGIAAIEQFALVAVNERDRRLATGCRQVAGVVSK